MKILSRSEMKSLVGGQRPGGGGDIIDDVDGKTCETDADCTPKIIDCNGVPTTSPQGRCKDRPDGTKRCSYGVGC